ncbi:MAG: efflux RND transporter periplasmic adaptor subunit [Acidiferrobacteraceae bacterium]
MNRKAIAVAVIAAAVGVGIVLYRRPIPPRASIQPVDPVHVVPLAVRTIAKRVTAYGVVTGAPGDQWNVSKAFGTEIRNVYVRLGQRVDKGEPLLKVAPAPSVVLTLARAKSALALAGQGLRQVRHRYLLKLATNASLLAARQRYEDALLHWQSLRAWGVGGPVLVRAPEAGLVAALPIASSGAFVPKGQTLVTVTAMGRLQATFGVEPDIATVLTVGRPVPVMSLNRRSHKVVGRIQAVSGSIDPKTRLVDVFVTLPPASGFLVGQFVKGRVRAYRSKGFVVPHSAVLPQDGRRVLYTVSAGRAVAHDVHIELRDHRFYEISGSGLQAGAPVVVLGNYELRPGMAVRQVPAR